LSETNFPTAFPELASLGVETRLEAGAVLWREGDAGDDVVLLVEGLLEVSHETPSGEVVILRSLEAGSVAGEMACLDGHARSATVTASTASRVIRVPAEAFRKLLRRRPDVLEQLFWMQMERVRSLTRQVTRTHHRAITDPLTHLYNYGFFRERLDIELDRARHTGDHVSLAMFDIDHFKHYNDGHGHQQGNDVLVCVADILRRTGRRGDVVARYGGEEFVALLYGASGDEASRFAESARRSIEAHAFPGGGDQPLGRITVSGGIGTFPTEARDDAGLIQAADANLYRAKQDGRNRILPEPRS
jgi:diguanylate cyclase (GGDEF)-like protein